MDDVEGSAAGFTVEEDDIAPAAYVRADVALEVGESARVGLDYRHLFADEYELFRADIEADEDQLVLTVGWGF